MAKAAKLPDEHSFAIENLYPVVLAIAHVNQPLRIDSNGVRQIEFAFSLALLSPGEQELSIPIAAHDARVAVSVRDKKIAVHRESDIRGTIEVAPIFALHIPFPERKEDLSRSTEFYHSVILVIRRPDRAVRVAATSAPRSV